MSKSNRAGAAEPRSITAALFLSLTAAFAAAEPLLIEDAWVRAMPPTQRMTAAYMTLRNNGAEPVVVHAVSAVSAADASLHNTRRDGDRVRMEAMDEVTVAPGAAIVLEPGGMHIMLMGLSRMPAEGDDIELCLQTSAGEQCAELPVRRAAAAGHDHH